MGKTKKGSKRALKESRELEVDAVVSTVNSVSKVSDDVLFTLDTTGSTFSKKKKMKLAEDKEKHVGGKGSVIDKKAEKLAKTHTSKALNSIVAAGKKKLTNTRNRASKIKETVRDLWSEEESKLALKAAKKSLVNRNNRVPGFSRREILNPSLTYRADKDRRKRGNIDSKKPKVLAVAPARQGQSYNPDFESHQQMLGVAVSAEIRRNELAEWEKAPLAQGMSDETMEILRSDSESSDDDSDGDSGGPVGRVVKRDKKKTRADRNRQRRHKERLLEMAAKKKERALLNEVTEVKMHRRKMLDAVKEKEEKKAVVKKFKDERRNAVGGYDLEEKANLANPKKGPTIPVALTEELGGG